VRLDACSLALNDLRTRPAEKTRMVPGKSALSRSTPADVSSQCAPSSPGSPKTSTSSSSVSSITDAAAHAACTPLSVRLASLHLVRVSGVQLDSRMAPVSRSALRTTSVIVG